MRKCFEPPRSVISPAERAAREVFYDLPLESRSVVREFLAMGHDMRSAILASNALGGDDQLRTPRDARQEDLKILDRKETAEHESAHLCTAAALGLEVYSAKINPDGTGECAGESSFAKDGNRLERANRADPELATRLRARESQHL